jgi:predicted nucleotidyltransferase
MLLYESTENIIVDEVKKKFGTDLISIVLFGSQARGTADEHSDIDLLVITENIPSDWHEKGGIINELRLLPGLIKLPVMFILNSPGAVKASLDSVQPLLFGILKGYKVLYDPGNFFETQAQIYRENMQEWDVQEVEDHVWRVGVIAEDAKKRANSASISSGSKS